MEKTLPAGRLYTQVLNFLNRGREYGGPHFVSVNEERVNIHGKTTTLVKNLESG